MSVVIEFEGSVGDFHLSLFNQNDGMYAFEDKLVHIDMQKNKKQAFEFSVTSPKLWWVRNIGDPYLYTFNLTLRLNGAVIDERTERIGIRQITFIEKSDKVGKGRSFMANINGTNLVRFILPLILPLVPALGKL